MNTSRIIFVIDFDSTFIKSETFELLGKYSLADQPEAENILKEIHRITDEAMEGKIDFSESLSRRIDLLKATKDHLEPLIEEIRGDISSSFARNKQFFKDYFNQIYIVSNGFREIIVPVVQDFGIPEKNVFANTFTYSDDGKITGFDTKNILSKDNGKVEVVKSRNLQGDIYVIGTIRLKKLDWQILSMHLLRMWNGIRSSKRPIILRQVSMRFCFRTK